MPFEIIRDDITHVRADAIVNTANPRPVVGAGTDSAIHGAAGPELLSARERIGEIPVGSAVKTPAFDLPARYVLHTVSPAWIDGAHGEEVLLRQAYDAALTLADGLGCRSVAFPLLSSGSYGFPKDVALSVAIRAFTDFLLTHDLRIVLVVFGEDSCSLARGLFGDLKSFVDANYVEAAEKVEYGDFTAGVSARRKARETAHTARFRPFENRKARHTAPDEMRSDAETFAEPDAPLAERPLYPAQSGQVALPNKADDLESFLKKAESTFSEHLLDLLNECGEKDSDVYRRAEISRQLFHKIISRKDYQPTKSTAVQLALGLRLDLAETQKLLRKAGYALTRSSKADLVVQYFIEHGRYSIVEINTALFDCGLPLLKTGGAV